VAPEQMLPAYYAIKGCSFHRFGFLGVKHFDADPDQTPGLPFEKKNQPEKI